jgi:glucose/arabinose dehydrogenase
LNDDGTPHPGNPFAGRAGARPAIWTLGHRNIQGLTRDPVSGRRVLDGTRVVTEEKLTIGRRVRDVRQGPDGYLYVLTDEDEGALLRILAVDE